MFDRHGNRCGQDTWQDWGHNRHDNRWGHDRYDNNWGHDRRDGYGECHDDYNDYSGHDYH